MERQWHKSSHSFANGNCAEVAILPDGTIGVRDSTDPDGPVLSFTPRQWAAFTAAIRDGELDLA